MEAIDNANWFSMTAAPRDGTEVDLLIRHENYRYARSAEDGRKWQQIVRSKWIDFNGGGWTWSGLAGTAVAWRPLPDNTGINRSREAASG